VSLPYIYQNYNKMQRVKATAPLQSWDIFSEFLVTRAIKATRALDYSQVEEFISKYNWNFDTSSLAAEDYTTIVVTDSDQVIQWVNTGFTEMTGYPKNHAVGKHPRFLQGPETSKNTKAIISKTLSLKKPVVKQLLNYKKDGTPYLCDIKIIPLFNKNQELTHFMALEKKARVA